MSKKLKCDLDCTKVICFDVRNSDCNHIEGCGFVSKPNDEYTVMLALWDNRYQFMFRYLPEIASVLLVETSEQGVVKSKLWKLPDDCISSNDGIDRFFKKVTKRLTDNVCDKETRKLIKGFLVQALNTNSEIHLP